MNAVDPNYRHQSKQSHVAASIDLPDGWIKWYEIAPTDAPIPAAITNLARSYFARNAANILGPQKTYGFTILHRCGAGFYFLLISVWRGNNELWQAVHYHDAGMADFAAFDPAYPPLGQPRPTFCVWELGVVAAEAQAWSFYLASSRDKIDLANWQATAYSGQVGAGTARGS